MPNAMLFAAGVSLGPLILISAASAVAVNVIAMPTADLGKTAPS
jgi:hypothetical protein